MDRDHALTDLFLLTASIGALSTPTLLVLSHDRWRASRWLTAWLLLPSLGALVLIAGATWIGSWFLLALAGGLVLMLAIEWDMHLGARRGDGGRFLAFVATRMVSRKKWSPRSGGRPLLPIDELRAEYGQGVLDDARRDPRLAHILDQTTAVLEERILGPDRPGLPLIRITAYANGLVDALSEPDRKPSRPAYRAYSSDMILVAALCQLHDSVAGRRRT
ncbi:DUF6401 family natural product biosynthesis protein [Micromonospora lupini]|uniref:DUF6401 family natural product biosynthesis protein n=1 Tax=Micromonospora lupini TaxID=285679 RepID=UPI0022592A88|nr:DUF6401 family natural product biosynthesis protein [Micromonospora lupini]MCX5070824.1 DUF6401 family natural product biosynthesis protein [Micromonospora lupini]